MSGITPWMKGQTSPTWTIPMVRDGGGIMNLTGVTTGQLSLVIYSATYAVLGTGTGTFTIKSVLPGVVTYKPAATDSTTTAQVGNNYVRVVVDYNGTDPDPSDYLLWTIQN